MIVRKEIIIKGTFKIISALVALALVFVTLPVSAYAVPNEDSQHTLTPEDLLGSAYYEPLTREEYITEYAVSCGISYSEAESRIDSAFETTLASMVAPLSWEVDTSTVVTSGVYRNYGRVIAEYTDSLTNMKVTYTVQASMMSTNYGSTWYHCSETGVLYPGSGIYNFVGVCTASLISTTQLRMVAEGYFEVQANIAINAGYTSEDFDSSVEVGTTTYFRKSMYDVHIEVAPLRGG